MKILQHREQDYISYNDFIYDVVRYNSNTIK